MHTEIDTCKKHTGILDEADLLSPKLPVRFDVTEIFHHSSRTIHDDPVSFLLFSVCVCGCVVGAYDADEEEDAYH